MGPCPFVFFGRSRPRSVFLRYHLPILAVWVLLSAAAADAATLRLRPFQADPLKALAQPPTGWALSAGELATNRNWLVQASSAESVLELRKTLEAAGAQVVSYVPEWTWHIRADRSLIEELATSAPSLLRWHGPVQPWYKTLPSTGLADIEHRLGEQKQLFVTLYAQSGSESDAQGLIDGYRETIEDAGHTLAEVHYRGRRPVLVVNLGNDDIREAARQLSHLPEVHWVEEAYAQKPNNDRMVPVVLSGIGTDPVDNALYNWDIYGQGEIVGILDSGLDADHCMFWDENQPLPSRRINNSHRKVVYYSEVWESSDWDSNNHGTHVAGTVAGDRPETLERRNPGDGIAPAAKLAIHDVSSPLRDFLIPPLLTPVFEEAYEAGARVHSNSWGAPVNEYITTSQETDEFTWENQDMLIFFSAGNEGPGLGSLGNGGNCKNCVAVGATANGLDANDMAGFSSHGPAGDGRIKPDVSAPGVGMASAGNDGDISTYNCGFLRFSGTSMSCPATAGAAALVRQYYREGRYPEGHAYDHLRFEPSAALVKATLIASTESMNGENTADDGTGFKTAPSFGQGWGRVNLDKALFLPDQYRRIKMLDERDGITFNQSRFFEFVVADPHEDAKLVLTWSDPPADLIAGKTLINDLDMVTVGPDGRYQVNTFLNGESALGKVADTLNNVEVVWLKNPTPGKYVVSVRGALVPQGPQPFAIVANGAWATQAGRFVTEKPSAPCEGSITFHLSDLDLEGSGPLNVRAYCTADPTGLTLTLNETSGGVYTGTVAVSATGVQGALPVGHGDTVYLEYIDADDAEGATNKTVIHEIPVDCVDPDARGVRVTNITGDSARIRWRSTEPTVGTVTFGLSPQDRNLSVQHTDFTQNHLLQLTNLVENTLYFFTVYTEDRAGNSATYGPFPFRTREVQQAFSDDFEFNRNWIEEGDGSWQWTNPRGLGVAQGVIPDPSQDHTTGSGRVWGTDLTDDGVYSRDTDASLISPVIDCTNLSGTQIAFWRYLNVAPSNENGTLSASIAIREEGKSTWQRFFDFDEINDIRWVRRQYDISQWADGKRIQLRWRLECTEQAVLYSGWNIDDVQVYGYRGESASQIYTSRPSILLAGFGDTDLRSGQPGDFTLMAATAEPDLEPVGKVELYFRGLPTGFALPGGDPFFQLTIPDFVGYLSQDWPLNLVATDAYGETSTMWPYLEVGF